MATALQLSTDGTEPTYTIDDGGSAPVVEALGGFPTIDDVYDRFPEEVYDQGKDTHLYRLLQALCGDLGAGSLKSQSYISRLKNEAAGLVFEEIDIQYSGLRFPRLSFEIPADLLGGTTGQIDPNVSVLTKQEWDEIEAGDNSYFHRIMKFLQATRIGNSPEGISLAAEAGSGVHVDVWETYKSVYATLHDEFDVTHNGTGGYSLPFLGLTKGVGEFVLLPHTEEQTSTDTPTFSHVTVADSVFHAALPTWAVATTYALGDYVTRSAGYDASTFPHVFVVVEIIGTGLSNATTEPTWPTDGTSVFDGDSLTSGVVWLDVGTASINDQQTISPDDAIKLDPERERSMVHVVDNIRPVGTLVTVQTVEPHYTPIKTPAGAVIDPLVTTSSHNFRLARWVTGKLSVTWPTPDEKVATENNPDRSKGYFIEAGVEKEQKNLPLSAREKPTLNHTIEQVIAYSDNALDDPDYGTSDFKASRYPDFHTGSFNKVERGLFPTLAKLAPGLEFKPVKAIALQNTPIIFERNLKA